MFRVEGEGDGDNLLLGTLERGLREVRLFREEGGAAVLRESVCVDRKCNEVRAGRQ